VRNLILTMLRTMPVTSLLWLATFSAIASASPEGDRLGERGEPTSELLAQMPPGGIVPGGAPAPLTPATPTGIDARYNGFVVIPDDTPATLTAPTAVPSTPSAPRAVDFPTPDTHRSAPAALPPTAGMGGPAEMTDSMSQVTSITQLTDVAPTDWAFQALVSLIERYGCIAGYPDGTFRGNQAMTRYEFAAGLNACLERFSAMVGGIGVDDRLAIERLQEEFAAELAVLRGRVDGIEARTAELEANQFSTTTRLNGNVIFSTAAVLSEDSRFNNQATFGYRMRMNFDSSFSGSDRLRIRLQSRDVRNFDGDVIGFSYGGTAGNNTIELDSLFYDFPINRQIDARVGANALRVDDLVSSTISPLDSATDGSISAFGQPPQYSLAAPGNAGAGLIFQMSDNLSLDLGYTARNASNPEPGNGLFNGDFGAIAQLTFLSSQMDAALTYVRGYSTSGFATSQPETANTYGVQVNYRITNAVELGGGATYIDSSTRMANLDIWSYQFTLAVRDLFGQGNMGGLLVGVPPRVADVQVNNQRVSALIEDASLVVEGFYRYQVSDNISITPGLIWVADPGNDNSTSDSVIGTIRTVFSF
jgi:hypothetical protein